MYTSGWPKNQNRCCHRIGEPPWSASKMWAPNWRSANSIAPAAVSTGNVISTSRLVTNMFQVKIGMRNMVMPGARMVDTVATTLTRGDHAGQPGSTMPTIHRSPPTPGERTPSDSGA